MGRGKERRGGGAGRRQRNNETITNAPNFLWARESEATERDGEREREREQFELERHARVNKYKCKHKQKACRNDNSKREGHTLSFSLVEGLQKVRGRKIVSGQIKDRKNQPTR